tara:strand:- start:276 stop:752 length:477 start_codon:yes stop_codon:yes gene_type:complete
MIVGCKNCNKKFDIDAALIPNEGRLLQCNSCNHKWFFRKNIVPELINLIKSEKLKVFDTPKTTQNKPANTNDRINTNDKTTIYGKKKINKEIVSKIKNDKQYNILNLTIVFLLSFVAFIILLDTFKNPIGKIFPAINFLLYNLYESFKDMALFINDLI